LKFGIFIANAALQIYPVKLSDYILSDRL